LTDDDDDDDDVLWLNVHSKAGWRPACLAHIPKLKLTCMEKPNNSWNPRGVSPVGEKVEELQDYLTENLHFGDTV